MNKLRVFEAFAGYGSQSIALRNLGVDYEVVAISEIDKYAIKAYNALHGPTLNLGDISKIKVEDIPKHDLFTYSFPCQDISVAGKTRGIIEGETRSGLLYECKRIIEYCKPKYLLLENVKNLVGKKFKPQFDEWLKYLESLGYTNYWKVLNAKDYGVPQNRERVFVISILGEHEPYKFPKNIELELRLKDMLEDEVDEKYYLSEEMQQRFKPTNQNKNIVVATDYKQPKQILDTINVIGKLDCKGWHDIETRVHDTNGIFPTIETRNRGKYLTDYKQPKQILDTLDFVGGIGDKDLVEDNKKSSCNYPQGNRVYSDKGIACSQTSNGGGLCGSSGLYLTNYRIRKLTPRECFRLKGISPTLTTNKGEGQKIVLPCICASRGRNPKDPSDRTPGAPTEQRLEFNTKGTSNTITTVQKDNYVVEITYRIRKLTPRECFRLMGLKDDDIDKIQQAGISKTQQYKLAGNSIVVNVLEAIFKELLL